MFAYLKVSALIILGLLLKSGNTETLVEYYTNLITTEVTNALEYELPTDARMYEAEDTIPKEFGTCDFIIVGAGSTGSVIANRLSEIGQWKICILEAGTSPNNFTSIPSYYGASLFSKYNWGFVSTPQTTACLGSVNQSCPVHRGKGIGGTSLINGGIYSRGNVKDFDRWAILAKDSSWSYENVLHYFKKSEDFHKNNPEASVDWEYHGTDGELHVTYHEPMYDIARLFIEANKEVGYDLTDLNGRNETGSTILQINTKHGRRLDQGTAFIMPVLCRNNLLLLDESYATKIEFNFRKEARSVIFTRHNKTYRLRADKEVIVSAGAILSPHLLMLSGIGPKQHLEELGISVVKNLKVGETLRDHVTMKVQFSTNTTSGASQTSEEKIEDYLNGIGSLTTGFFDGAGFYQSKLEQSQDYPDLEFVIGIPSASKLGQRVTEYTDETYDALFNLTLSNPFSISPVIQHSVSKGTVRLKSSSPFDYPLIDPNVLSDPENRDIDTLYEGILLTLKLGNTTVYQNVNTTLEIRQFPACAHTELLSKEFWYCYIRQTAFPVYHPVGTCPVGVDPRRGAVVDSNLKVHGVKRLRVADASVFPLTLAGHPNAACTMVGEKISDVIKLEYGVLQ